MTSTLPFSKITGAESAAASDELSKPTTLLAFMEVPNSISTLRARWYSCYRGLIRDFLVEQSKYAISHVEAAEIADARIESRLSECEALDSDNFLMWCYQVLFPA